MIGCGGSSSSSEMHMHDVWWSTQSSWRSPAGWMRSSIFMTPVDALPTKAVKGAWLTTSTWQLSWSCKLQLESFTNLPHSTIDLSESSDNSRSRRPTKWCRQGRGPGGGWWGSKRPPKGSYGAHDSENKEHCMPNCTSYSFGFRLHTIDLW